jgi:hypothetical protein
MHGCFQQWCEENIMVESISTKGTIASAHYILKNKQIPFFQT